MKAEEVLNKNEESNSLHDMACNDCESLTEYHYCPYAYEIYGDDSDDYCKCCDTCMGQCSAEI